VSLPADFWANNGVRLEAIRPIIGGAIGKAVASKRMVVMKDPISAAAAGEYVAVDPRVCSEIVVPILAKESFGSQESVVALIILSRFSRHFLESERKLLNIVASIISNVYNNSLAREQREKQIHFLKTITELKTIDLDVLFHRFLVALATLIPSRFVSLWLYNELDDTLVIRSFYPDTIDHELVSFEDFDSRILDCSKSLSGQVVASKLPQLFTQVQTEDVFSNRQFAKRFALEWFICVPILDLDEKPLGVINLWPASRVQDFSEDIQTTLSGYISPIANTVRLASLLFEEQVLFSYDEFFQNMLAFEDEKSSWDRLASLIETQMRCEACSIFLVESDGLLHLKGSTGLENDPSYDEVVYKRGEGLTGTALIRKTPLIYYRETQDQHATVHISKFREKIQGKSKSIIFVQVLDKDNEPIGVIRCNNKEESPSRHVGRFTPEDVLQLQKISKIISHAHSRVLLIKQKEKERERNLNSLHHEILSPVDGILAHIEWLENHLDKSRDPTEWDEPRILLKFSDMKQISRLMDIIVTSTGRFEDTIKLNLSAVSVSSLLQICSGFIRHEAARKRIRIIIDYLGVPLINGDELQLMRVFYNLFRNAIKYSDPNERDKFVRVYCALDEEDFFVISFTDNGIGILSGEEERIFGMFERGSLAAKYFPEGSGLGLAFCRSIMRKHDGSITVNRRELGKPTQFLLKFPKKR
jgi:signal transduction histidine kinase